MHTHSLIKEVKRIRDGLDNENDRQVLNVTIEALEDGEHTNERLYASMRENYELKHRIGLLMLGRTEK